MTASSSRLGLMGSVRAVSASASPRAVARTVTVRDSPVETAAVRPRPGVLAVASAANAWVAIRTTGQPTRISAPALTGTSAALAMRRVPRSVIARPRR